MNAYELADELQELDSKLHLINLFKSANMLRQQADLLIEMKKLGEEAKTIIFRTSRPHSGVGKNDSRRHTVFWQSSR
jgi:hypothetical protein